MLLDPGEFERTCAVAAELLGDRVGFEVRAQPSMSFFADVEPSAGWLTYEQLERVFFGSGGR